MKFKAEAKFLEGKFAKGEVDLDVAKLAVIGEGKAPELLDLFGVELPDGVRDNLDIKVSVRAEVALSAEDVARLARMSKHGREMAKHVKAMAKEAKKLDKLKKANKTIEKQLSALKKSKKKGVKKAREKLLKKLATNKQAMRTGAEKIARSKAGYKAAEAGFKAAAKGLKSGAGKMAAKALLKGTAKTLAKLGARLIPGLNIALAVVDIVEVGMLLYKWADGQIEFGGPGGGEGGTKGEDGGGGGGEDAVDGGGGGGGGGVADGDGDAADAGAGGDGKSGVDGDGGGGSDAGVDGATGPAGEQGTQTEPPPKLHAGAQAVLDLIKSSGPGGVPFDNDDLQMFNEMIPKNLSDDELKELAARIAKAGVPAGDAFAVVGYVREEIDRVRKGDPVPQVTVNGTDHSDLATDGKAPEDAAPTSPAQDVEIKAEGDKKKAADDKKKAADEAKKAADDKKKAADEAKKAEEDAKKDKKAADAAAKKEADAQKKAKPPKSLVPEEPINFLSWNAKDSKVEWSPEFLANILADPYTFADGLVVSTRSVTNPPEQEKKTIDGQELVLIGVAMNMVVDEVPAHAGKDYPYTEGEEKTETFIYWFHPVSGKHGRFTSNPQIESGLRSAVVQKGGAWVLKDKGGVKDIGVGTVSVDELLEQSSTAEGDSTVHSLVFQCTPKKIVGGAMVMDSDGELVQLKKDVPVKLKISFDQTMKAAPK